MCGRFNITTDASALLAAFGIVNKAGMLDFGPRYNIAPSQSIPVLRAVSGGQRELTLMRWGLVPHWAKETRLKYSTFNARAETAATSPAFRTPMKGSRCLIPASGFYEWKRTEAGKQPFNIVHATQPFLAFAGLWDAWHPDQDDELLSCSILTTEANATMRPIHDRMPVILALADVDTWLNATDPAAIQSLLKPCPDDQLRAYAVSTRVNSTRNDDPQLVEPRT